MSRTYGKYTVLVLFVTLVAGSLNAQSIWQKIKKSAQQTGQDAAQQGTQQVQQKVQQQVPGAANQMNGTQQPPCGSLTQTPGAPGGATLNNASYNAGNVGSCGQQCFNAGPFDATVTQMTMSQQGYYHIIRMNVQFHNATNQPLIIAYHDGSMVMVDNLGNTYGPAGGNPGALQGMGTDRGNQTDSQFVLGPGQSGNALFSVARVRGNDSAIASGFAYNLTIDELQAQNGAQAIPVRQYNLNFPTLAPGASNSMMASPGGSVPASSFNGAAGGGAAPAVTASPAVQRVNARGIAPQGKGSAIGSAAQRNPMAPAAVAAPVQGTAATPDVAARAAAARNPRAVNNAALQSNAAAPAKPAAAVKPIPAKTPARKATQPATTTPPAK